MMENAAQIAPSLIAWLDLFGIAVFAASGALAAAQRGQTLVTFSFFALVTGVGGGTVRDLLIGAPVFWVQDWRFAATCLVTAGLVWVTPKEFLECPSARLVRRHWHCHLFRFRRLEIADAWACHFSPP